MEVADIVQIMEQFEMEADVAKKAEAAEKRDWYGEQSGGRSRRSHKQM